MVTFLQRTFTSLVHAHAGCTQAHAVDGKKVPLLRRYAFLPPLMRDVEAVKFLQVVFSIVLRLHIMKVAKII